MGIYLEAPMFTIQGIDHIVLRTNCIDKMIEFGIVYDFVAQLMGFVS